MTSWDQSAKGVDTFTQSIAIAIIIGIISSIIGAFSTGEIITNAIVTNAESLDPYRNFIANTLMLVFGKIIIDCSFSIIGLLILYLSNRFSSTHITAFCVGLLQCILLMLYIFLFWDPGWQQILEPGSGLKASFFIIVLGFFQAIAFLYAGLRK